MDDAGFSSPGPNPDRFSDRLAITELLHRYAYHFDRNEPERVAALFSDDAVIDYGPEFPQINGRAEVAPRISAGLNDIFDATSHHISNILIDFDEADEASVVAYVHAWHRYLDGSPDGQLWGQYHLRCRRSGESWNITRLTLLATGLANFHREQMHPIGRQPSSPTTVEPTRES